MQNRACANDLSTWTQSSLDSADAPNVSFRAQGLHAQLCARQSGTQKIKYTRALTDRAQSKSWL